MMPLTQQRCKILTVDDTPSNLLALQSVLDHKDYELIEASSGEAALEILFQDQDFALILMDVQMPGMNGFETVSFIKSRPQCASIPVIFLTAINKEKNHIDQGYESGAIDFVTKPYDPVFLQAKVAAFIEIYTVHKQLKLEIIQREEVSRQLDLASRVFEHAGEGIMITNTAMVIETINPAFEEITGYSIQETVGKTPGLLSSGRHSAGFYQAMWDEINAKGNWEGEICNRRKNGETYQEWLKIVAVKNKAGEVINYIGSFSDITAHTSARQRLYHLAHYDNVTELPNRVLFNDVLEHELSNARRRKSILAVFFMDLDHFKDINDTLGHAAGDELLKEVSKRLLFCKRDNDLVARQGGDEFTGVMVDLKHAEDAAIVAKRMLSLLAAPITLGTDTVHISASIGLSIFPNDGEDVASLTSKADTAMYHAKEAGRNNFQFHTEQMYQDSIQRIELESNLRNAIKHNEFELYYQPQIDAKSKNIIGMETLIRWNQPDMGMVSPADFIPLAEETGLIVPIGEWVLRTACQQAKVWQDKGFPTLLLSVNLSSHQFRKKEFMQMLHAALHDSGLPAEQLQLELTERIIMHEDDFTIARLQKIHDLGIHLSIDDFGTGYSSMSYLKRFPLNELKIDKSFVDDVCEDGDDRVIVAAMINLAHALNLSVIAEGVEQKNQLDWLECNGCDAIQGYYFSRPLAVDAFEALMLQQQ
ncbi:MAG: EAL domain-containing protein [Mariprofundus sp.]|nr:EAL domain-containing protein [Mariprofundus sp.]